MSDTKEMIHTGIWKEEPQQENPFVADTCYCHGYDVFGDLLGKASWIEYLFLLFVGERPTHTQAQLLEQLAVALAHPGIREYSVRAAMVTGVARCHPSTMLTAALAVGAGQYGGSREVAAAMKIWSEAGQSLSAWKTQLEKRPEGRIDVLKPAEHPPGFDPHGVRCSRPVVQTVEHLAPIKPGGALDWLLEHRSDLEELAGCPLAMSGVAAAAFHDLGLSAQQAEALYLIFRLPGAAAQGLEQTGAGWRKYPFFREALKIADDPGPMGKDEEE